MAAVIIETEHHSQSSEEAVLDPNLGGALLDGSDSPGNPGDVLTSQGPGQEPIWAPGGGGTGGGTTPTSTDQLPEGTTNLYFTDERATAAAEAAITAADLAPQAELDALAAEVAALPAPVTPDWNAVPGDPAEILNKPPIPNSPDDIGAAPQAELDALQAQVDALPEAVTPDWNAAPGAPGEILNKPALGTAAAEDVGVADGVAPLDATAKVPAIHLPSYVDDVVEVADEASLPDPGEAGVIYVTTDTNAIYRWSGTGYVEIQPSPGTTDDVPEGAVNLYFTDARAQAVAEVAIEDAALASQADLDALAAQVDAIPDPVKPDWNAVGGDPAEILNKPAIPDSPDDIGAASQADLDALQAQVDAIPAVVTPDWNAAPGAPGEILNKPAIPDSPDDIGAASQADLDALEAQVAAIPAPVKPDWNAAAGTAAEILNKPPLGTAAALDVGLANGVAPLDALGHVPAAHLPSYVDDLIEVADYASLPQPGESGVVYFTLDTTTSYRWGGTAYVEITGSPGSTDAVPEGAVNLYYTDERATAAAQVVVDEAIAAIPPDAPYELPIATTTTLGGVSVKGPALAIDAAGALRAVAATVNSTGTVQLANDAAIAAGTAGRVVDAAQLATAIAGAGEPLVPATATALGGVVVGTGFSVDAAGLLGFSIASLPALP